MVQNNIYISLGCDCAVKWNLKQLGFVEQTFPFDWANTNKLKIIIETLDMKFSNFFDYEIKGQSSHFDNFDKVESNVRSQKRLITKNRIIFPHEAVGDYLDDNLFREKYTRRINRFTEIVCNEEKHKIFVRSDNKSLTDDKKDKLIESLERFGAKNYEVKFISYDVLPVYGAFDWKRSKLNWRDLI